MVTKSWTSKNSPWHSTNTGKFALFCWFLNFWVWIKKCNRFSFFEFAEFSLQNWTLRVFWTPMILTRTEAFPLMSSCGVCAPSYPPNNWLLLIRPSPFLTETIQGRPQLRTLNTCMMWGAIPNSLMVPWPKSKSSKNSWTHSTACEATMMARLPGRSSEITTQTSPRAFPQKSTSIEC